MVPYVQCEKFQRSFCPPAVDTPTLPNITCQLDTQIGSTEQHEENSILGRFQLFCIRSFQFELNLIVPGAPASCRRSANSPQQQQQTIFYPHVPNSSPTAIFLQILHCPVDQNHTLPKPHGYRISSSIYPKPFVHHCHWLQPTLFLDPSSWISKRRALSMPSYRWPI